MPTSSRAPLVRRAALFVGPLLGLLVALVLPGEKTLATGEIVGLGTEARACAGVGALMAAWWLTEAIPLSATALLPIVLFPLLGVLDIGTTTARYAHEIIFLFMGGFLLALAMQRWNLHKRIALFTILIVGTQPKRMIAGFMVATALLSMFVSNTATAIMLVPIALSVVEMVKAQRTADSAAQDEADQGDAPLTAFATCLVLAIAYSASIGGVGTIIGTPPNIVLAGIARDQLDIDEIGFARWMLLGVPIVVVFLPIAWLYLTRFAFPHQIQRIEGGRSLIRDQLRQLGPMSRAEWTTFVVFALTATLWIVRPLLQQLGRSLTGGTAEPSLFAQALINLNDTTIAMGGALILFLLPANREHRVLDWRTAEKLPWGILILFGGGLALAKGISDTGLDAALGSLFVGLQGVHPLVITLLVVALIIFLTELTSNTAITNAILPVLISAAAALEMNPLMLMIPASLAASCAFMLPVATPPNAVAFASGHISISKMARAGFAMNLLAIGVVVLASALLVPLVFGG